MSDAADSTLAALVAALPECYQPIYGHPELSVHASRPSADRLAHVAAVHDTLTRGLGRPLRVLDLGCAQGFFSLSLAARGAHVRGVELLEANVAVCAHLRAEHPGLNVRFDLASIVDVLNALEDDEYDLALGLSVFHHLVHAQGESAVRDLIARAIGTTAVVVLEMARRDEPAYWAESQPHDPRALLHAAAFVHELGRHATHLSEVRRPLYVASNRVWVLDGHAEPFDSVLDTPHRLAAASASTTRRYFLSDATFLKHFRLSGADAEVNRADIAREAQLLTSPPAGLSLPAAIASGENEDEAWLARPLLPGRLLLDLLIDGVPVDGWRVMLDVLDEAASLERSGLYHSDIRTWNVLVDDAGRGRLIDYASISEAAHDRVWPHDVFLSFLIFVREVATGVVEEPQPIRTTSVNPFVLPPPFRNWALALWQRPRGAWSFALMQELATNSASVAGGDGLDAVTIASSAIENVLAAHDRLARELWRRSEALAQAHTELPLLRQSLQSLWERVESVAGTLVNAHRALRRDHDALAGRLAAIESRLPSLPPAETRDPETPGLQR